MFQRIAAPESRSIASFGHSRRRCAVAPISMPTKGNAILIIALWALVSCFKFKKIARRFTEILQQIVVLRGKACFLVRAWRNRGTGLEPCGTSRGSPPTHSLGKITMATSGALTRGVSIWVTFLHRSFRASASASCRPNYGRYCEIG